MINKKKSLAIVITLSIFASFCLAASLVILLGLNALSIGNLFAGCAHFRLFDGIVQETR